MHTSEYLQRLSAIRRFLKDEACDTNQLLSKLVKSGFNISKRQIYFDISDVKKYLLNDDEQLIETLINKQKKIWQIIRKGESLNLNLSIEETYKLLIIRETIPLMVNEGNIENVLYQVASKSNRDLICYKNCSKEVIVNTNYFQKKSNNNYFKTVIDFYNAILTHKKITIIRKVLDATCVVTKTPQFNITPICLLYHVGSLYISGYTQTKKIIILDVSQIVEYSISARSYNTTINFVPKLKEELSKRFGISENIDDKVYDIEIEFSTLTGEYLKLFNFHPTQKFRATESGYILSLKCGINRELVGWIFTWMDNARILKPEKLKKIYIKQVNSIIRLNTTEVNLNYSNIFTKE